MRTEVTEASLAALETSLADTMEQYRSAAAIQKQRYIGIEWLGALVKVQISGVFPEFTLRKAAKIKQAALATRSSGLPPLLLSHGCFLARLGMPSRRRLRS